MGSAHQGAAVLLGGDRDTRGMYGQRAAAYEGRDQHQRQEH
jgi:hypothetical protein